MSMQAFSRGPDLVLYDTHCIVYKLLFYPLHVLNGRCAVQLQYREAICKELIDPLQCAIL